MKNTNRAFLGFAIAGIATKYAYGAVKRWRKSREQAPPGWERENHRGGCVTLDEGPALVAGLTAGTALSSRTARSSAAYAIAVSGAGVFGLVDDVAETGSAKGIRGHLGALARGELTTGGVKILGIGVSSLLAAATVSAPPHRNARNVIVSGALIAGMANLGNLLDLRPGRVLKAASYPGLTLSVSPVPETGPPGAILGAVSAVAADDLSEHTMAGDSGANALGAAVGMSFVVNFPRPVRESLLAGVVMLTLASEKWSFSKVIEDTPILRNIDGWGRRK